MSTASLGYLLDALLPGSGWLMLYAAYIDESYTDEFPVFAVGGYLVREDKARDMDAEWRATLAKYRVPYFHMADVNACKGIFEQLGDEGCDQLAREMIGLIKKYISVGWVTVGNVQLFGSGMPDLNDDAYTYCLLQTCVGFLIWLNKNDPDSQVMYFFESGHPTCGSAWEILNTKFREAQPKGRIGPIASDAKINQPLLQAADLVTWQVAKFVKGRIRGNPRPRRDYLALVGDRHVVQYANVKKGTNLAASIGDLSPWGPNIERDIFLRSMFGLPDSWGPQNTMTMFLSYRFDPPKSSS